MSTNRNFKTLDRFNEPTDIVILGSYEDVGTKFEITDDETCFTIQYNDGKSELTPSSMGFGSIMTLTKYKDLYEKRKDMLMDYHIVDAVLIPSFVGEIGIAASNGIEYITDFDLNDYIMHQVDDDDYNDVVINLPISSKPISLNDDLSIPIAALRGIRIEDVVNNK